MTVILTFIYIAMQYSNIAYIAMQMTVILTFFNTRAYTLGVRRTLNQTDSGVTCSRS